MQRKAEDEGELAQPVEAKPFAPDPDAVAAYVASVQREWRTFSTRTVNGEILTRMYGAPYDWKEGGPGYKEHGARFHFAEGKLRSPNPSLLQQCKDFAEESLADEPADPPSWAQDLSESFLEDISTLNEFVLDVEAVKNCERMFAVFAPDDRPMLCKLAVVEFMAWKHRSTGEPRFPDENLLYFNDADISIMDAAFKALQAAEQAA
jgi:hypothetical protein